MAKVLIVDDASIMRLHIRKILEELGHLVIAEAESGFEAVKLYKSLKPDFVTMDITMPMTNGINDGIEAVVKIKEIDANAKIIMITSHGEQDKVIKAIKAGANNYILKPLQLEKFKDVINKLGV